jgi:hypothetical protein
LCFVLQQSFSPSPFKKEVLSEHWRAQSASETKKLQESSNEIEKKVFCLLLEDSGTYRRELSQYPQPGILLFFLLFFRRNRCHLSVKTDLTVLIFYLNVDVLLASILMCRSDGEK